MLMSLSVCYSCYITIITITTEGKLRTQNETVSKLIHRVKYEIRLISPFPSSVNWSDMKIQLMAQRLKLS